MKLSFSLYIVVIVFLLASCNHTKDEPIIHATPSPLPRGPQVQNTVTFQSNEHSDMRETVFPSYQLEEYTNLSWDTFGLQKQIVYDIDQASDGFLWFATSNGVESYDGKDWAYYRKKDGLAEDESLAIKVAKNGVVWVGSAGGRISTFDQKIWKTFSGSWGRIRSITEGKDGTLWFGASCEDCEKDGGVISFDGANWKIYTKFDGLLDNNVNDVLINSKDELLVTSSGGLSILRGKNG